MTAEQARLGALIRFAGAITILSLIGNTILGFETSVVQALVCVATAYTAEIILETVGAWSENRTPRFTGGGLKQFVIFLLPAHITGMATSILLYPGDRFWPFVFAVTVAIASKSIFVVTVDGRRRHFLNPSNTGLVLTIFLFPTVALAPPYHFTENLYGYWDWALTPVILCTGTFLNARFTKRMPLILAFVGAFALQAVVRHFLYPTWLPASLMPMTGVAFLLFTFYMITDPQTSPSGARDQIIFGVALGAAYGIIIGYNVVFTAFVALFFVCLGRGIILYVCELDSVRRALAFAERQWLTSSGHRPPVTKLPVTTGEMMQRFTKP